MSRTLTITAADPPIVPGEIVTLVWEGEWPKACSLADPTDCNGEHCDCPLGPPVEFALVCAPCARCDGKRRVACPGPSVSPKSQVVGQ